MMEKPANDNFSPRFQCALTLMAIIMECAAIAAGAQKGQGAKQDVPAALD